LASIYNWKETKDDFFTKQESSHYLPIDKTNKMKAAKNSLPALTMMFFVFESIYNWNESETPL
jgi:hypothetical protein